MLFHQLIYAVGLALVSGSITTPFILLFKRTGLLQAEALSAFDAQDDSSRGGRCCRGGGGDDDDTAKPRKTTYGPDGMPIAVGERVAARANKESAYHEVCCTRTSGQMTVTRAVGKRDNPYVPCHLCHRCCTRCSRS